jgi:hypothetical protein
MEDKKDLRLQMFDSLISLMEEARVEGDMGMMNSYARLVYETYQAILEEIDA